MRNMWFHTGDIGKFDDEGFFYFVDRKKDYLRRRGENISSFEMESAFAKHPAILEVAVHAVPSDKGEDDVKVTAILRDGASPQGRGSVSLVHRCGALLRAAALHRVSHEHAQEPPGAGAQVPVTG
jgi:acyl-CoA synthetase (AMP-forming)/AMP-acid ligase II